VPGSRLLLSPTGSTRVAGVIGSPVGHSLSPVLHNAAFEALGLDWVFVAFDVPEGSATEAIAGARALGIDGLSVTMPHKAAVAHLVDALTPDAEVLQAVNCVVRVGADLLGANTDGAGLLDALRVDEGFDPDGRRCLVVGAGGAARAVVRALAGAGAADVVVVNRTAEAGAVAAALAGPVGRVGEPAAVAGADLVVNATPLGMRGAEADALPLDPALLAPGQLYVDLVYDPPVTPALVAARARGVTAVNGVGMLIHQAAHAFRLWTGEDPPLEVMSAAALAAIAAVDPSG
jgi:shikimate dehydrogenase